jgi:succinyl-diaminopimelate desuccinylase
VNAFDPIADNIDRAIEAERDSLIALCGRLVAAVSVNPPGVTCEMAETVTDYLKAHGVPVERVAADSAAPNVVASVAGPRPGRHVVFNAHMDTMEPGNVAAWSVPPFELTRRDGRLYGLGMGNMKGALAAMCLVTALLHRHRDDLAGRLTLTAVSDEVMFGDRGTVQLLRAWPELAGDFLISGEGPGFMDLAVAEKGLLWLDVEAVGPAGHSSRARAGETATMRLAAFLARLDSFNEIYATPPPELDGVSGGDGDLGFRLSLNAGSLTAGTVRSQIATSARAELDIRLPPGLSADAIERRVRAIAADDPNMRITRIKAWDANWTPPADPLAQAVLDAALAVRARQPRLVVRLPGSDARRWREREVPAICYGPQPTLSAGIDDYAEEQDVMDCAKVYARAALSLMRG